MNGRSIPPNDHNLSTAASDAAEIDAAIAQYKSSWPELCKQLSITPNMLRRIDPRILIAICMIRMNAMYAGKMMILEARLRALEPSGPMMPIRRHPDA
jgi:hypothetical protein